MPVLLNIPILVLLLAIIIGAGHFLLRRLVLTHVTPLEQCFLSLGLGLGLVVYGATAFGFLGFLRPLYIWGYIFVLGLVATWEFRAWRLEPRSWAVDPSINPRVGDPWPSWALVSLIALFGIIYLISNMAPPLDGDTLHSYLNAPRRFVDAGRIYHLPYIVHSVIPLNIQMLSAVALVISGDELAQMLAGFTMLAGCCTVLFCIGNRYLSSQTGMLAALLFASMNCVQVLVPSTKVNLGWAFFELISIYCLLRWWLGQRDHYGWLLLAGIMGGVAFGSSYASGYTIVVIGSMLLWRLRHTGLRSCTIHLITYLVPAVALGAPWLLRNFVNTGNPVYPVLNPLFGLPAAMPWKYSGGGIGLLTICWDMSVGYIIGHFGKPVGPWVLLPLPGLILLGKLPKLLRITLVLSFVSFLLWFTGPQYARNLLPTLGLAALASAWVLSQLSLRQNYFKIMVGFFLVIFFLFNLTLLGHAYLAQPYRMKYLVNIINRSRIESVVQNQCLSCPNARMTELINSLPADSQVASLYLGNGYYIKRSFWDSRMLDGDFLNDHNASVEDLIAQWRLAGITHVFVNREYLIDHYFDKKPIDNFNDYRLFLEAVSRRDSLRQVAKFGRQELWEILYR